ncbi:MAG: response regulator transcription factor [Bdellovibrionia bacterium]
MNRILIVEDSLETQKLISLALGQTNDLVFASTFQDAINTSKSGTFDLILLDVTLPDGDGFQLCSIFQNDDRIRDVPIVFLTAHDGITSKLMGFSLGADDYIAKPFDSLELKARVEGKLRGLSRRRASAEVIQCGPFQVNLRAQKCYLTKNGRKTVLDLTPIEFKLLVHFMQHAGQVLSRDQLMTATWGDDVHVIDRSVDTHVSKLRKKIGSGPDGIQSIYGTGYVFSGTQNFAGSELKGAVPRATSKHG